MGFIKAFAGAIGGMLGDQWLDFYTIPNQLDPSAAIFPAVQHKTDAGRGSNRKGSEHIITNGSKLVVPEGYGLVTMVDGAFTGLITEPGGYIFQSNSADGQSLFIDGFVSSTLKMSWERFKFGGIPTAQHLAFYVCLKDIPNNRFGTQSEIYWDDAYLNAQVGAITRGTYSLRITDPLLFIKGFVPASYYAPDSEVFSFSDLDNPLSEQLFNEVVACLAPAFSRYCNAPGSGHRISQLQSDSLGLAQSLSTEIEQAYHWTSERGLLISHVTLTAIEYDQDTRALLSDVKKADALAGARGNSFMQQAAARGIQAAGENGGAAGLAMFGMGIGGAGSVAGLQQPGYPPAGLPQGYPAAGGQQPGYPATPTAGGVPAAAPSPTPAAAPSPAGNDLAKLTEWKQMLDAGLITAADYEAAKQKLLGL